jgi:hypothetical protein
MSWLDPLAGGGYGFRMSLRRGDRWSEPRTVASGKDILMFSASLPAVVQLPTGDLLGYWEKKDHAGQDPYAETITMAVSSDEGRTWSSPVTPHRDGMPGAHAFVSAFPVDGRPGLVWLDARNRRYVPPPSGSGQEAAQLLGSVGLFYTTVDAAGQLGPEVTVDPVTCECCPTAAAVTRRGPVVAYRDRTVMSLAPRCATTRT